MADPITLSSLDPDGPAQATKPSGAVSLSSLAEEPVQEAPISLSDLDRPEIPNAESSDPVVDDKPDWAREVQVGLSKDWSSRSVGQVKQEAAVGKDQLHNVNRYVDPDSVEALQLQYVKGDLSLQQVLDKRQREREIYAKAGAELFTQIKGGDYNADHPLVKAYAEQQVDTNPSNKLPEGYTSEQEHTFNRIRFEGTDKNRPSPAWSRRLESVVGSTARAEDTLYNLTKPIAKEALKTANLRPTILSDAVKGILPMVKLIPRMANALGRGGDGNGYVGQELLESGIDNLREWVAEADSRMDEKLNKIMPQSVPELQGRQQAVTKVGNFLAAVPGMVAAPVLGGPLKAAMLFTLSTGGNVYDAARAAELQRQKGAGETIDLQKATEIASAHEALALPMSLALNLSNPLTKALGSGTPFADGLANTIYRGALTGSILGGADAAWQKALDYAPEIGSKELTRQNLYSSYVWGDGSVMESALFGGMGGAIGGLFTSHAQPVRDQTTRNIHDEFFQGATGTSLPLGRGKLEFAMKQLGLKPDGPGLDIMSALAKAQGSVTGKSEEVWHSDLLKEFVDLTEKGATSKVTAPPPGMSRNDFVKSQLKKVSDVGEIWNKSGELQQFKVGTDLIVRNLPDVNVQEVIGKLKDWADQTGLKYNNDQDLFGAGMLHYTAMGRAPTGDLAGTFEQASKGLRQFYSGLKGLGVNTDLPVKVERAFDELFAMEDPLSVGKANSLEMAQDKFNTLKNEYGDMQKLLKKMKADPKATQQDKDALQTNIDAKKVDVLAAKKLNDMSAEEFRVAKTQRIIDYTDKTDRTLDRTALDNKISEMIQQHDMKTEMRQSNVHRVAEKSWRQVAGWFGDASMKLSAPMRELGLPLLMNAAARRDSVEMMSRRDIKLTTDDMAMKVPGMKKTFQELLEEPVPGTRVARGTVLLEPENYKDLKHGIPDQAPEIQAYLKLHKQMSGYAIATAQDVGTLRRLPSGDLLPLNSEGQDSYSHRGMTENGFRITDNGGYAWEYWKKDVAELNGIKEDTPEYKALMDEFDEVHKQIGSVSALGMLEKSRFLKRMSDYTMDESGNLIQMLHTNPYQKLTGIARKAGVRAGLIEQFGNGKLKNASLLPDDEMMPHETKMMNEGYKTTVEVLQKLKMFQDKETPEYRNQALLDAGVDPVVLGKMKSADRDMLADSMGINTRNNPEELKQQVMELTSAKVKSLVAAQIDYIKQQNAAGLKTEPEMNREIHEAQMQPTRDLTEIAQRLGGIDTKAGLDSILAGIKQRLTYDPHDMVLKNLEVLMTKTEDWKTFEGLLRKLQGIPGTGGFESLGVGERGGAAIAKTYNDIFGTAILSRSAIANLWQTAATLPRVVGFKNTALGLMDGILGSYDKNIIQANVGAIKESIGVTQLETRSALRRFGFQIRTSGSKIFGLDFLNDFNELVTALATDRMVQDIRRRGVSTYDLKALKMIDMTPKEIQRVQAGDFDTKLITRMKLQMIRNTQYTGQESFRRADLLNYPVLRLAIPLMTYSTETLKTTVRFAGNFSRDIQALYKNRDLASFKNVAVTSQQIMAYLAAGAGAGFISNLMIQGARSSPPRHEDIQDDSYWDEFRGAMVQAAFLGPLTRITDSVQFSGGSPEKYLFSFLPTISSGLRALNIFAGPMINELLEKTGAKGKFTSDWMNLPWYRRLVEATGSSTPLLNDIRRRTEYTMFPQAYEYDELINRARAFKASKAEKEGDLPGASGKAPINPDYDPIFNSLRRGDVESFTGQVRDYYRDQLDSGKSKTPHEAAQKLRSSLMARAPIPFTEGSEDWIRYMISLPKSEVPKAVHRDREYRQLVRPVTGY